MCKIYWSKNQFIVVFDGIIKKVWIIWDKKEKLLNEKIRSRIVSESDADGMQFKK